MVKFAVVFAAVLVVWTKTGLAQDFGYSDIKDLLQIGGNVEIKELTQTRTARNLDVTIDDKLESFIKSNEVTMNTPFGSTVTFNGTDLDNGQFDLKIRLKSGSEVEARKKSKSRLKRIIAPILVILLLKAITLIPLAIGLAGLKTWNALQLAFVSFVTSVALAVWKMCAKFSDHNNAAPQIIHEAVHDVHIPHVYHDSHHDHHVVHHDHHDDHYHEPWNHHYHRSDENSQQMAYNGYVAAESKM